MTEHEQLHQMTMQTLTSESEIEASDPGCVLNSEDCHRPLLKQRKEPRFFDKKYLNRALKFRRSKNIDRRSGNYVVQMQIFFKG